MTQLSFDDISQLEVHLAPSDVSETACHRVSIILIGFFRAYRNRHTLTPGVCQAFSSSFF